MLKYNVCKEGAQTVTCVLRLEDGASNFPGHKAEQL